MQLARRGPKSRWKFKKAHAYNTLKTSIRYIKLSSNHENLYTSTEKVGLFAIYQQLAYKGRGSQHWHDPTSARQAHLPRAFPVWTLILNQTHLPKLQKDLPSKSLLGYVLRSDQNICFPKFKQLLFLKHPSSSAFKLIISRTLQSVTKNYSWG